MVIFDSEWVFFQKVENKYYVNSEKKLNMHVIKKMRNIKLKHFFLLLISKIMLKQKLSWNNLMESK